MLKNSQKKESELDKTIIDAMKMYPNLSYNETRSIMLKPLGENIVALASRVKALEERLKTVEESNKNVKDLTN